jgi:hypothetical protein
MVKGKIMAAQQSPQELSISIRSRQIKKYSGTIRWLHRDAWYGCCWRSALGFQSQLLIHDSIGCDV